MNRSSSFLPPRTLVATLIGLIAVPALVLGIAPVDSNRAAIGTVVDTPGLRVTPTLDIYPMGAPAARELRGMTQFMDRHPGAWEVRWDARGDRPNLIQGAGIPVIAGRGNTLPTPDRAPGLE